MCQYAASQGSNHGSQVGPKAFARALIPAAARMRLRRGQRAIRRERRALRVLRRSYLDALATHYGTDKSSDPQVAGHNYVPLYERHLSNRRRQIETVLEIGVGGTTPFTGYDTPQGGQSLRMWRRYFPNATIVGIDIHYKNVTGHRIYFEQGSQSEPQFLQAVAARYGPFDLIVDDGSHIGTDIHTSFAHLWEAVRCGGYYVIEDIGLSYSPGWGGGPPGTPNTAAALIKQLVDSTLDRAPTYDVPPKVAEMHVYHEIVFLRRPFPRSSP